MTIIKSKKDIHWFNLSNYEFLKTLTKQELETQLTLHLEYLEYTDKKLNEGIRIEKYITEVRERMSKQWEVIFNGKPNIISEPPLDTEKNPNDLWHSNAISGQSVYRADFNARLLNSEKLAPLVKGAFFENINLFLREHTHLKELEPDIVTVEINLKDHTDREIVSEVILLLKAWREQLNIPEPKNIKFQRANHHKNIVEYKIIPLIDLKRWELISGNKLEDGIIMAALFPDNYNLDYKRTIKPFYKNIISSNFRYSLSKTKLKI